MNKHAVIFLSDVHLSQRSTAITAAFVAYLSLLRADPPQALFILGDLFDVWYGDDLADHFAAEIAAEIAALAKRCPVFYQHGNRDFLIGRKYARQSGMTLLPQRYLFSLDGKRVLLEHGDLLCTDDIGYQRLRRIVRHPWFTQLALRLPHSLVRKIGDFLRRQSAKRTPRKAKSVVDVNAQAVSAVVEKFAVDWLIHGHTHLPATHRLDDDKIRFVLGDWRPVGEVLSIQAGAAVLRMADKG